MCRANSLLSSMYLLIKDDNISCSFDKTDKQSDTNLTAIVSNQGSSDGLGSGQCLLLGSGQLSMVWAWVWKIFPKYSKFFPLGSRKISSSQVKKYRGKGRVGFLFTTCQKYAWVMSVPISIW